MNKAVYILFLLSLSLSSFGMNTEGPEERDPYEVEYGLIKYSLKCKQCSYQTHYLLHYSLVQRYMQEHQLDKHSLATEKSAELCISSNDKLSRKSILKDNGHFYFFTFEYHKKKSYYNSMDKTQWKCAFCPSCYQEMSWEDMYCHLENPCK